VLDGHTAAVTALAWLGAAGRRWLASGSADRSVLVWDLAGPTERSLLEPPPPSFLLEPPPPAPPPPPPSRRLAGHTDTVRSLCWLQSPAGAVLASGSLDATIRLWDAAQPAYEPRALQAALSGFHQVAVLAEHAGSVNAIVQLPPQVVNIITRTSHYESFTMDGTGFIPNVILNVRLPPQPAHPERQLFASSSADKSIVLWDLPTRRVVARQEDGHELGVCALAAFAGRPA
jgi:WD40 repeat protein